MSTLAEVQAALPQLSIHELAELEQFVRKARLEKAKGIGGSALDLPPLELGELKRPLGSREELVR